MPQQKVGDRQVVGLTRERLVELARVRADQLLLREGAVAHPPARPRDGRHREAGLAQQRARHRRLAMDEFGADLGWVAKILARQGLDASAAALTRLQDRHRHAGARQYARGHQAGGAGTDDDD